MAVTAPIASPVPGLGTDGAEDLSVARLGLRRVLTCRVGPSLLAWLQSRSDDETPGGIGDVFVKAVIDGLPILQKKGLTASTVVADLDEENAAGGRLIAFAVDGSLLEKLSEVGQNKEPGVVEETALAAVSMIAKKSGRKRRASTRSRKTATTSRKRANAVTGISQAGTAQTEVRRTAIAKSPESKTRKKAAGSGSGRSSSSRRSVQAKKPQLKPLAPEIAASLEAGELSSPGLRALRESMGFSQAAAAAALGVSRGLVADAERGRRAGQQTLQRLIGGLRPLRAAAEEEAAKTSNNG